MKDSASTHSNRKDMIWPIGIISTLVSFALMIGYMVFVAMRTEVNMVSPDYYTQDTRYEQRMEAARQAALPEHQIQFGHTGTVLSLTFPEMASGQAVEGKITFYRPSDSRLDFHVPVQLKGALIQELSTEKLAAGLWKIKVQYVLQSQTYYQEYEFHR